MQDNSSRPIGVFDSGLGGMVVASELATALPNENIIYFGDFANMPYGSQDTSTVQSFCIRACNLLMKHNCKLIVIACNSATAAAYHLLQSYVGKDIPVINVITPTVAHVAKHYTGAKIGLIGTELTIRSKLYHEQLRSLNSTIHLQSLQTPLLASMIENGCATNDYDHNLIEGYILDTTLIDIDALILGCTHYPLISAEIIALSHKQFELINPCKIVIDEIKQTLTERGCYNTSNREFIKILTSYWNPKIAQSIRALLPQATECQPKSWAEQLNTNNHSQQTPWLPFADTPINIACHSA